VLATVHVGQSPMGVAVDPGLSYVFIGNRTSNDVTVMPDDF
jgi:DNA-binding beta-propeller fold protein YncE